MLSPEICVERKSISDLKGSLASGRLYHQVGGLAADQSLFIQSGGACWEVANLERLCTATQALVHPTWDASFACLLPPLRPRLA